MKAFSEAVAALLGPQGTLAQALPEYEPRPQQLEMACAVAGALAEGSPLLVEAGTGTGKTLAYLVPAVLSGKKVVVSTGTHALQQQIFTKDIPLLRERLGVPFSAALLKGVSNYLCRRRLGALGDTSDADLVRIAAWATETQTGDKSELAAVAADAPAWRTVTTTPDARLGPRCPYFDRCFVTLARRQAARAQLIVVNHHLFFADLALRAAYPGAQVLPPYDAVVFDEAHQVEEIATEHFGVSVSTARLAALLRDARRALPDGGALLSNLEARGDALFAAVRDRLAPLAQESERLTAPADLFASDACREGWFRVDAALEELGRHAARRVDGGAHEDADAVERRAQSLRDDLAELAEPAPARRYVHWAELRPRALMLNASPIDVGPLVRQHVIDSVEAAVFTSATLATSGRFDYLRERLGLAPDRGAALALDSPFDFEKQALLYLPRDLPAPKDPGFAAAAFARIAALVEITRGRAFVLFTSHRALREAERGLRPLVPHPLLVQGDAPPHVLVEKFRRDLGSVLLATSSFWEGVDVPGEALSLVILEKLPFAAPDDPLTAARIASLEERGEDAFARYQLPRAVLALKQGFGRLIRRRSDRGIVAVLDHRILTRAYGQLFLDSLPRASRTSSLEQVRRWW